VGETPWKFESSRPHHPEFLECGQAAKSVACRSDQSPPPLARLPIARSARVRSARGSSRQLAKRWRKTLFHHRLGSFSVTRTARPAHLCVARLGELRWPAQHCQHEPPCGPEVPAHASSWNHYAADICSKKDLPLQAPIFAAKFLRYAINRWNRLATRFRVVHPTDHIQWSWCSITFQIRGRLCWITGFGVYR
jgi:hypothetical protein